MTKLLLTALLFSACAYETHFDDCTVHCTATSGCPDGFSCGAESWCRVPGASQTCEAILGDAGIDNDSGDAALPQFTSCTGLAKTCGPAGNEDCCATGQTIPGGTFYRSYDVASDGLYTDMSYPATVSSFRLDRFEVTVGRFRKFVEAGMGTQVNPPAAGSGAHTKIAGSGWDASWNGNLATSTSALIAALKCQAGHQSWTDTSATNEAFPINCVTWYDAVAFCAWDDAFLPTEPEWNYAASGGAEQRAYPWSTPSSALAIDCSYANYNANIPSGNFCVDGTNGAVNRVGTEAPKGDGRWGQSDLGGNINEWVLDGHATYSNPCTDCANLSAAAIPNRMVRGSDWANAPSTLRSASRNFTTPATRDPKLGFRCARLAP